MVAHDPAFTKLTKQSSKYVQQTVKDRELDFTPFVKMSRAKLSKNLLQMKVCQKCKTQVHVMICI